MKKTHHTLLKIIISGIILFFFFITCVYRKITHLDKDELKWITNRYVGERMLFKSQNGDADTAVVTSVEIKNSLNPINTRLYDMGAEYLANARVEYNLISQGDTLWGRLSVKKTDNDVSCNLSNHLDERFCFDIKPVTSIFLLNNEVFKDVIVFNEKNSHLGKGNTQLNPIVSYVWSKKYGLLQYSFKNGMKYTRVFSITSIQKEDLR